MIVHKLNHVKQIFAFFLNYIKYSLETEHKWFSISFFTFYLKLGKYIQILINFLYLYFGKQIQILIEWINFHFRFSFSLPIKIKSDAALHSIISKLW